jgi:hypothetical protein
MEENKRLSQDHEQAKNKESEGGGDVFLSLKMIHASWMLFGIAVVFTPINSPYMFFNQYPIPLAFLIILSAIFSTVGGYYLSRSLVNKYFGKNGDLIKKHLVKRKSQKPEYEGRRILWPVYLSLPLLTIIIIIDIVSVSKESFNIYVSMISQYHVYWGGVLLLMLTFLLLLSSIIRWKYIIHIEKEKGEG